MGLETGPSNWQQRLGFLTNGIRAVRGKGNYFTGRPVWLCRPLKNGKKPPHNNSNLLQLPIIFDNYHGKKSNDKQLNSLRFQKSKDVGRLFLSDVKLSRKKLLMPVLWQL